MKSFDINSSISQGSNGVTEPIGLVRPRHLYSIMILGLMLPPVVTSAYGQNAVPADSAAATPATSAAGGHSQRDKIETITVTAQRRATNLQKTPVAVTAFSVSQLLKQGAHSLRDLTGEVPNVFIPVNGLTPSSQQFYIRGIGVGDPVSDPAVAIYVDDVYLPRGFGNSLFDLPDLSRVEVLRGPQGTLFGRNSSGGAIRIISSDPTDETKGEIDAGYGDYGAFQTHGLISGALFPGKLDASLAFSHEQRDGYTHDPTINRDVNDEDINSFRAKLRLQATDDLEAMLSIDGLRDRSNVPYFTPLRATAPSGTRIYPNDPSLTYSSKEPVDDLDAGGVSLRVTDKITPNLTFKSITSGRFFSQSPVYYDLIGIPTTAYSNAIKYTDHDYTQEFQLLGNYDRFNFVTGLFYIHEYFSVNRTTFVFPPLSVSTTVNAQQTDSEAAYAQGSYKFTDKLTGTFGGRFSHEHRIFDDTVYKDAASGVPTALTLAPTTARHAWNSFTPKVGLDYQWTPEILQYISYSEGFKSGGYDNRSTLASIATTPYLPETVKTYETGVKATWLDGRLRTNLALFYNDYSDLQAQTFIGGVSQLKNAGSATTEGVELETTIIPFTGVRWENSGGYEYAVYDKFANPAAGIASASGNSMPNAPRWNFNSTLSYVLPLNIPGAVQVQGNIHYQTKIWGDILDSANQIIPSQYTANASVSYTTEDNHWTGTFTATNLTDDRSAQQYTYVPVGPYSAYTYVPKPPRMVFASVRYTY